MNLCETGMLTKLKDAKNIQIHAFFIRNLFIRNLHVESSKFKKHLLHFDEYFQNKKSFF